jgi:hypothetical protein
MPPKKNYVRLAIGKLRRQIQHKLQPMLVANYAERRLGECKRCSACCRLPFRCPWLIEGENGNDARCRWYDLRPTVCRLFPITQEDIEDRNRIMPQSPCGYSFGDKPHKLET